MINSEEEDEHEQNRKAFNAYMAGVGDRIERKTGFNNKLAERILKSLFSVFPEKISLPRDIVEHPSFHNTLGMLALNEPKLIEGISATRMAGGQISMVQRGAGASLSYHGFNMMQDRRKNVVKEVVSVIAAVLTAIATMTIAIFTVIGKVGDIP